MCGLSKPRPCFTDRMTLPVTVFRVAVGVIMVAVAFLLVDTLTSTLVMIGFICDIPVNDEDRTDR